MNTLGNINAGMVGGAISAAAARVAGAYLPLPLYLLPPHLGGQRVDVAMSTGLEGCI